MGTKYCFGLRCICEDCFCVSAGTRICLNLSQSLLPPVKSFCPHFFFSLISLISHRDLLDLSCVGDDLLHDLHGLALGLSCLSLTLGCRSLDNLYLLALTHLHGHRCTLIEREDERERKIKAERGDRQEEQREVAH